MRKHLQVPPLLQQRRRDLASYVRLHSTPVIPNHDCVLLIPTRMKASQLLTPCKQPLTHEHVLVRMQDRQQGLRVGLKTLHRCPERLIDRIREYLEQSSGIHSVSTGNKFRMRLGNAKQSQSLRKAINGQRQSSCGPWALISTRDYRKIIQIFLQGQDDCIVQIICHSLSCC